MDFRIVLYCIVSLDFLDKVCDFHVLQHGDLPSDHAPITMSISPKSIDLQSLLCRAASLGGRAVLCNKDVRSRHVKKLLNFHVIDKQIFKDCISQVNMTSDEVSALSINELAEKVSDVLYENAEKCQRATQEIYAEDGYGRWERLMNDKDDMRVWKGNQLEGRV